MRQIPKIISYFLFSLFLGALLAPALYEAGQALARQGIFPELERIPFSRYFNRAVMLSTIALLWPFVRWVGIPNWRDWGLEPNPNRGTRPLDRREHRNRRGGYCCGLHAGNRCCGLAATLSLVEPVFCPGHRDCGGVDRGVFLPRRPLGGASALSLLENLLGILIAFFLLRCTSSSPIQGEWGRSTGFPALR